jgi:hypothetical protein
MAPLHRPAGESLEAGVEIDPASEASLGIADLIGAQIAAETSDGKRLGAAPAVEARASVRNEPKIDERNEEARGVRSMDGSRPGGGGGSITLSKCGRAAGEGATVRASRDDIPLERKMLPSLIESSR